MFEVLQAIGALTLVCAVSTAVSPYLCRVFAAYLLAWGAAWDEWGDARRRYIEYYRDVCAVNKPKESTEEEV